LRVLAVDVGTARSGLALSDPSGLICRPLDIIEERDHEALARTVAEIATREGAGMVLVGVPRSLRGHPNKQSILSERFAGLLRARFEGQVVMWDERFTTTLARRLSPRGHMPDDARAACYLLQSYLDAPREARAGIVTRDETSTSNKRDDSSRSGHRGGR
jgi:putative Holliday junction resolvase